MMVYFLGPLNFSCSVVFLACIWQDDIKELNANRIFAKAASWAFKCNFGLSCLFICNMCIPPSKYFQRLLKIFKGACFKSISKVFLQSTTSQTWKDRGALLSLCCQITPSCRLVKFPFQSIVSTQPGATAPSIVPGCNPPTHPSRHIDPTKE